MCEKVQDKAILKLLNFESENSNLLIVLFLEECNRKGNKVDFKNRKQFKNQNSSIIPKIV